MRTETGCIVGTVGLSVSVTGERYSREAVGQYSNNGNRYRALYINRCTFCTVGFTVSATGPK